MTPGPYREEASHSIRMRVADGEELQRQVALIGRRRPAHGYRLVQELQGTAIGRRRPEGGYLEGMRP